jgi:hypothetical protein
MRVKRTHYNKKKGTFIPLIVVIKPKTKTIQYNSTKKKRFMKYFSVLFLMVLVSCSPQRRFTRLITKHPHLIKTDTIIRHDTVTVHVPMVQHDTSFHESFLHDTVFIEKERLKIKIWKELDTVYVDGMCDTVTVTKIIETKIPVHYYEKKKWWCQAWIWWTLLILAIALTIYILWKRKGNVYFMTWKHHKSSSKDGELESNL